MDLPVDKFIEGLLSKEAVHKPSDSVREDEIEVELPPWYDKDKFEKARNFFWNFSFAMTSSMLIGLVAVFSIPSILKVLMHSNRSTTLYTAYKRYLSTILHVMSWFENKLEPGSISWKSLTTVRKRHLRAALSAKSHYQGTVSQRDLSLTLFGFMGFALIKPDHFGIRAVTEADWDNYIHFWRTIGYMVGIEDRYNICRKTVKETRQVCQILLERVYTPCLENLPEYFEHMAKVMIEGLWSINPTVDTKAVLFKCKYLAEVPGYIYTEGERIAFQNKLEQALGDRPDTTGIPSSSLISEPALYDLPTPASQRLHFIRDYDVLEKIPAYKCLTGYQKYKLNSLMFAATFYHTNIGRWFYNFNYGYSVWLMKYLPYLGFFRFGIKSSYVNIFVESPKDLNAKPKPNSHYYNKKPVSWIREWIEFYWGEQ